MDNEKYKRHHADVRKPSYFGTDNDEVLKQVAGLMKLSILLR